MRVKRTSALLAATLALVIGPLGVPAGAVAPVESAGSSATASRAAYRNPVSAGFADTFADPSVIRGKDGYWYSYGTSDPLREGEKTPHRIPIARSTNLVDWTYVGDAFTAATVPTWADTGRDAALWAPDIRYVDGQYRLYYVVTQTTVTAEANDNAVGMATAPSPTGPWTDSGAPVVSPRRGAKPADDFLWTFDPSVVTDEGGAQWIFYGSYYGGIYTQRLTADGRSTTGSATQVAIDNKFEGAYPVRHGGYWYLFASTADCCAGPTTGYSVQVGRSRSITGPYRDRQGVSMTASRAGGTPTLVQNGNRWIGAGHNAVVSDLAGQDWIAYHAINRSDPYLDGTEGINERPMLLDRLDWVKGWPAVRAGRGPSSDRQAGPATGGRWVTGFAAGIPNRWRGAAGWSSDSADAVTSRRAGSLTTRRLTAGPLRVEADLRSSGAAYGLQVSTRDSVIQARLVPSRNSLELRQVRHGRVVKTSRADLPAGTEADWQTLALNFRNGTAVASVSHAGLGDPLAMVSLQARGSAAAISAGALAGGAAVQVDNLSVVRAAKPVRSLVHDRVPSRLDRSASDEFNGTQPGAGWSWVRPDDSATVTGGVLKWPVQSADLTEPGGKAAVLLRDPGSGSWTAQTKVRLDLGTDVVRNYEQAGLIAYVNDDLFVRLDAVAIWNTRQTEFLKEMPYAGRVVRGGTIAGPPAATTWLRLTHRVDPNNGEHELRAWSSRDGRVWVKGGVWTLPADAELRVGLVSLGKQSTDDLRATARFDYFRMYR
jgi:arabinan endo-1,5-alpha-L-arabinosidase